MFDDWFNDKQTDFKEILRTDSEQKSADKAAAKFSLYHYESCVFCARVRKTIRALNVTIELCDVMEDRSHLSTLATLGGKTTVPCLRIEGEAPGEEKWLYESSDISEYLIKELK